jgi:hypothetical protein
MSPEQLVLVLLVVASAVLTVVVVGCLRTLADLRIALASGRRRDAGGEALAAGQPLPEPIAQELPWLNADGLVLFVSPGCPLCSELMSILPQLRIRNIAVGVLGERSEEFGDFGVDEVVVLSEEAARQARDHFAVEYVPFGVHQRDGVIVGSIHTEALVSIEQIERFWAFSGARLMEVAA